jgi:hypothetical protein
VAETREPVGRRQAGHAGSGDEDVHRALPRRTRRPRVRP